MVNLRVERMMNSVPDYYLTSEIFTAIQSTQAYEFDRQEDKDLDLQLQVYVQTATWGLKYYEEALGIVPVETDSYEIRRSRILAMCRGFGNFSAALIKSVCEAFTNGEVTVTADIPNQRIQITFTGTRGIPENLDDLKSAVDNIIHAHIGHTYVFVYLSWDELDRYNVSWDTLDLANLTWSQFEIWIM